MLPNDGSTKQSITIILYIPKQNTWLDDAILEFVHHSFVLFITKAILFRNIHKILDQFYLLYEACVKHDYMTNYLSHALT
jgi:hypothetical protein